MQPTYIPWAGYFEMIDYVDRFVFLDNVQLEKPSWQVRNRIKTRNGELFLTIPVKSASRYQQKIMDTEIIYDQVFPKKHFENIRHSYASSKYFSKVFEIIEKNYSTRFRTLSEFNISIIQDICDYLEIDTEFFVASELESSGVKTQLSFDQCVELGGSSFYAANGSKSYLSKEDRFLHSNLLIEYQEYVCVEYEQLFSGFLERLSIIDILFNHGKESIEIIRRGRCLPS